MSDAKHVRPITSLEAWTPTEYEGHYPPYVNVSQVGTMIRLTVRGPTKDDGACGEAVAVEMNIATFSKLFGDAAKKWRLGMPDWVRELDDPPGCPQCGAIAGACSAYPNCPGGVSPAVTVEGKS